MAILNSLLLVTLALVHAHLSPSDHDIEKSFSPAQVLAPSFIRPEAAVPDSALHLFRRQSSSCAASYTACPSNLCCQPNTHCTTDFAGRAACCPNNAVCIGTISGASAAPRSTTPPGGTGAGAGAGAIPSPTPAPLSSTATVTVTVPYAAPTGASVATVTAQALTGTVPNAPFAWAYIPRSFENAGQCSSYYSGCQSTLSACTSALGGGAGVTVVGLGVTTGQGAANPTSAASVCSSLSTVACGGLQENLCGQYGGSTNEGSGRASGLEDLARVMMGAAVGVIGGWIV